MCDKSSVIPNRRTKRPYPLIVSVLTTEYLLRVQVESIDTGLSKGFTFMDKCENGRHLPRRCRSGSEVQQRTQPRRQSTNPSRVTLKSTEEGPLTPTRRQTDKQIIRRPTGQNTSTTSL